MRILFVQHSLKLGGGHAITSRLVRTLGSKGHAADVFYFDDASGEPVAPKNARAFVGTVTDLLEIIWRERYDIVHGYSDGWDSGLDLVHYLCPGTKLIVNGQGVVNPGWTSRTCSALTVCAQWMAEGHQPVTDLRADVVLNAVDGAEFPAYEGPVEGPPIILWVGRVTDARKGVARIAEAAPHLNSGGVRLWLACPEEPVSIKDQNIRQSLESCANRWQAVPFSQMPALYRQVAASSGCLVSTAHSEGMPLALLEAQSSGCPVIAFDAKGVNEAISVDAGALLLPETATGKDLARETLAALADQRGMQQRGRACAAFTRARFNPEIERDAFLRIYNEAPYKPIRRLPRRPGWRWRDVVSRGPAYREHRWANANAKMKAGVELRERGHLKAARRATVLAIAAGPILAFKPTRLRGLVPRIGK
jgi:glycosyltransferase involved in cell wall biosynthesis